MQDYIDQARRTLSPSWHGASVSALVFFATVAELIDVCNRLDHFKKALFYGRQLPESLSVGEGLSATMDDAIKAASGEGHFRTADPVNMLHGIIGKATEAGEMLEALMATLKDGKPFDLTNVCEEVGDGFWYDAIVLHELGMTFADAQYINIEKLRKRFPARFTEHDANNRDLFGERGILERREHPRDETNSGKIENPGN